jgi:hypothetical protein
LQTQISRRTFAIGRTRQGGDSSSGEQHQYTILIGELYVLGVQGKNKIFTFALSFSGTIIANFVQQLKNTMKKLFSLLVIASSALLSSAQNDLVVFSEQGERFYVVVDGIRQNAKPETNVKITGIKQPMVTVKIIFDGGKIPDIDQKIYFVWEGEDKNGWEFTYAVVKKGDVYKLKPRSAAQIVMAPPPAGQTVVIYSTTPPVVESTTTTISTTTTSTAPAGDNFNVNMNIGGVGVGFNVNAPATNTSSTTSTTVITSTTTTSSGVAASPPPPVYVLPGYNGPYGCPMPMSNADFESAKNSIKAKSFEDSKLTVANKFSAPTVCFLHR